ncbi:hypothetical protein MMC14_003261 [Varicellaria rhodocarpa]|nr:hypothetical protein [Varicellaria rhodocarpa]
MYHTMLARKKTIAIVVAVFWISIIALLRENHRVTSYFSNLFKHVDVPRPTLEAYIDSWLSLEKDIAAHPPNCNPPERLGNARVTGYDATVDFPPLDLLRLPDEDVDKMKQAHASFVATIKPRGPILAYTRKSQGIVTTAGGYYLPVVVISIRMLRRTGSRLPVEVFLMAQSEYEEEICNTVLPELNAKCIVLSTITDAVPHSINIAHYQLKIFSILFSTFEEVIFLDADSFPLHDPAVLLRSTPFTEYGMVTWPDFWSSTISEKYYNISSQTRPGTSLRASSETGEILISKKTHEKTLLLAAYYNYYGPTHYYPLLSQGAAGEGDKETFLASAVVLDESYYAVGERVNKIGHWNPDKQKVEGSAMIQHDPRDDYRLVQKGIFRAKDPKSAPLINIFFIHANFPKFNPSTIFNDGGPTRDRTGKDTRVWTDDRELIKAFGFDVEKRFWEEILWTACNLEGKFGDWVGKRDICANVERYWKSVFGN